MFFVSVTTFAQNNIDRELLIQTPNCESVAYNSSRLIERYFGQKNYDSIRIVFNRWEEFCGTTEPLFRLKVLHQIQDRTFSEEWMDKEYIMNFIFLYLDRLDYAKEPNAKQVYERYKIPFGYISLNSNFDDLTVVWAISLLEKNDLQPVERAFCMLYSNQTDVFWQMLKDQKLPGTKLQDVYSEQVLKTKNMIEGNMGFMAGMVIPTGNLNDIVGVKSAFGVQFGLKRNKLQYDLSMVARGGTAKKEYLVQYHGEPKMTDHFSGAYIGLDLAYELKKSKRHELDFLSGIAYDGFDAVAGDPDNDSKAKTINSVNLNFGVGYRYCGKKVNYIGIQTKYNLVNYNNPGGTNLNGNYFSLILTYNMFGNIQKHNMTERLKMK